MSYRQDANMMLADMMFRKNEHDSATFHFQQVTVFFLCTRVEACSNIALLVTQLLERNPTRYSALAKLIKLLRRGIS
jgi:hypothetical protein